MDKKQKLLLLTLGTFFGVIIGAIVIYLLSMFIACAINWTPLGISIIIGTIIVIATVIVISIYKRFKWVLIAALILVGIPITYIAVRFHEHEFSDGYIEAQYDSYAEIDEYGNIIKHGYGYDKFGRKVELILYK